LLLFRCGGAEGGREAREGNEGRVWFVSLSSLFIGGPGKGKEGGRVGNNFRGGAWRVRLLYVRREERRGGGRFGAFSFCASFSFCCMSAVGGAGGGEGRGSLCAFFRFLVLLSQKGGRKERGAGKVKAS